MRVRVAVVGAGLAGLFTASELVAAGVDDLVVLERGERPGGVARTIQRNGYLMDSAVSTFQLPNPFLDPVFSHAGLQVTTCIAQERYLFDRSRLRQIHSGPRALASMPFGPSSIARTLLEPLIGGSPIYADESLSSFATRRFGVGAGRELAWLAASGVHAGDPDRLSAPSAFPRLVGLETTFGSVIGGMMAIRRSRPEDHPRPAPHAFVGGVAGAADRIASRLGDRLRLSHQVTGLRRERGAWVVDGPETVVAEMVVLAVPTRVAARVLGGVLGGHLESTTVAPVVVMFVGAPAAGLPLPPGVGALVTRSADLATLGVLFESSSTPGRARVGNSLVKIIAGGATRPEVVDLDDTALEQRLGTELSLILGSPVEADHVEIVRPVGGIPQYEVGHGRWLRRLDDLLRGQPGLELTGWGYRGVGVAQLAADAQRVAGRIVNGRPD